MIFVTSIIELQTNHTNMYKSAASFAQARAASNVMPKTRIQGTSGQTIGGVSKNVGGGRADLGVNSAFGFTHTSAADETVKIGDPTGAIEDLGVKTVTAYTSGSTYLNPVLNDLLRNPVSIDLINWGVTAVSDFNDSFEHASVNMGGKYLSSPLNTDFTMGQRNTQQNSLLLTGEWPEGIVLGPLNCLFIQCDTTTMNIYFRPRDVYEV